MNLTSRQRLVLYNLKIGCFISLVIDHQTGERDYAVMDEDEGGTDEVMHLREVTVTSMIEKGLIVEVPCPQMAIDLEFKKYVAV
jgi:hypothetical protein